MSTIENSRASAKSGILSQESDVSWWQRRLMSDPPTLRDTRPHPVMWGHGGIFSKYFLALVLLDTTRNISPCLSSVSGAGHQLRVKVSPSRPGQGRAWQMEGSVWPNPVHYGTLSVLKTIILLTINKKRPYSPNPLKCKHTHADRIWYSIFF